MSSVDIEERPAKKRRFFVDDSPIADRTLQHEPSSGEEIDALQKTIPNVKPINSTNLAEVHRDLDNNGAGEEFDSELLLALLESKFHPHLSKNLRILVAAICSAVSRPYKISNPL